MHTFGTPRTCSSSHFPALARRPTYDRIIATSEDARAEERQIFSSDGHSNRTPSDEPGGLEMSSFQHRTTHNHDIPAEALYKSSGARDDKSEKSGNTAVLEPGEGGLPSRSNSILSSALRKKYTGWRAGAVTCTGTAATVLVVNTVLTIWATYSFPMQDGIGTLIDGSCSRVKTWGLWLHLAINALSTLLLGASNYCMQYLISPTRQEIDKAHARRVWLDIGVRSVRNLRYISSVRLLLWCLLGLSSVPLHLMYNSAVFEAVSANHYNVLVVTEGFLSGAPWSHGVPAREYYPTSDKASGPLPQYTDPAPIVTVQHLQDNVKTLERLDNAACMKAYQNSLLSDRRNLLAVTSAKPINSSNLLDVLSERQSVNRAPTTDWICSFLPDYANTASSIPCDVSVAVQHADSWKISDEPVEYCLSEKVDEHCKLQFSKTIMVMVIVCNVLKVCCMLSAVLRRSGETLVTTGDAVASFLDRPDATTRGKCLMSKRDIVARVEPPKTKHQGIRPKIWLPKLPFWFNAPSLARWLTCVILCFVALSVTGALLEVGIQGLNPDGNAYLDIGSLYRMGVGAVNVQSLINMGSWSPNVLIYVLLGNLPQAILSFLYLMYNSLYTCMLQGQEWSNYGHERKTLRVTSPVRKQRSTYYLTLPYTYAVPLLCLSGLLHWLVSQSIFLVRITMYAEDGTRDVDRDITTCGYSCIAIIFILIVGGTLQLVAVAIGFRQYKPGIPLASSCSAAISAACHPPVDDVDAAVLPLMWGVVKGDIDGVGHCTFTSQEVVPPVKGRLYAGSVQLSEGSHVQSHDRGNECRSVASPFTFGQW